MGNYVKEYKYLLELLKYCSKMGTTTRGENFNKLLHIRAPLLIASLHENRQNTNKVLLHNYWIDTVKIGKNINSTQSDLRATQTAFTQEYMDYNVCRLK